MARSRASMKAWTTECFEGVSKGTFEKDAFLFVFKLFSMGFFFILFYLIYNRNYRVFFRIAAEGRGKLKKAKLCA